MNAFQNNFPGAIGPTSAAFPAANNQGPEPVTRSFIMQFALDISRGKYKDREEEIRKIQAKIDAAVSAGKILDQ
jgi:hypothetical protein